VESLFSWSAAVIPYSRHTSMLGCEKIALWVITLQWPFMHKTRVWACCTGAVGHLNDTEIAM